MDSRHAVRHAHALDLARRALTSGARASTVEFLTGLDRSTLRRYFIFDTGDAPKPGKRPDSPDRFLKNATLFTMIDASMVYATYRDHCDRWPHPAEALLSAFEHCAGRQTRPELTFDRTFYVVCWTDRLWAWTARDPAFRFTACDDCHCRYLAPLAAVENHARDCPFCRLAVRYSLDPRVRDRFPEREYPEIAAAFAQTMISSRNAAEPAFPGVLPGG